MASLYDKVARCYATLVEMMADRGVLSDAEMRYMRAFGRDEIVAMAKSANIFTIDVGATLCVIFYTSRFKLPDFKPYLDKADGFKYAIVVLPEKPSAANMKFIADRQKKGAGAEREREREREKEKEAVAGAEEGGVPPAPKPPIVVPQVFVIPELLFNITRHRLVPKHEVVADPDEISQVIKRYNVRTRTQLPIILRTDPVARYFGLKPGQLMRITRISPSSGLYTMYRCCV